MALGADRSPHDWQVMIDLVEHGGAGVDAAPQDPSSITRSTQHQLNIDPAIQSVEYRLKYDNATTTVAVDCVLVPWGKGAVGTWRNLKDRNGNLSITLTIALTTDQDDGTFQYTVPIAVFAQETTTLLAAVKTGLDTDGTDANAVVQARPRILS